MKYIQYQIIHKITIIKNQMEILILQNQMEIKRFQKQKG